MNRIEIVNVSFSYGKHKILQNLSMTAQAGQCVGIVGRNGCGKSTLLSLVAGMRKLKNGAIIINGQNVQKNPKIIQESVGFVPQEDTLFEDLSVADNLKLWYTDRRVLQQQLETGVLQRLGIKPLFHKQVRKLSGGQKKRVSIACALAGNPDILVLDEPGAALDMEAKAGIADYLMEWKKQGGCILITTHEEQELAICDALLVLKNGQLTSVDSSLRGINLVKQF